MNRNIITGYNLSWIVGFREHLVGDVWVRSPRSDWVFAIRNESREPIPTPKVLQWVCAPDTLVSDYVEEILYKIQQDNQPIN
jgi:hypothetical protein